MVLSASKVSMRKVPPLGFSIQGEQVLTQNIASWIWSYGGDFVSSDGKHSLLKDPKTKVGLKTFLKIIGSKLVSDPALLQLSTGDVITEFFLKDAYSFVIASPWPLRIFLNPEVPSYVGEKNAKNYGITFVPKGPAGRFCFGGGSALAITSFTKHPQEADLLLKFLSTADSQKRYCRHIGMYPGRKDVDITLPFLGDGQEDFKNAVVKFGRSFPSHPLWGSVERIISSGLSDALVSYSRTYNQKIFLKNIDKLSEEVEQIFNLFGE